jgi:hypothetical protein
MAPHRSQTAGAAQGSVVVVAIGFSGVGGD